MKTEEAEEEEQSDDEVVDDEAEQLEHQAQVLMTQAAKRRAGHEKARGFQKQEGQSERDARVAEMKSRMCCSACKAHGFTRYGHWHNDKECPYYGKPRKSVAGKSSDQGVFAVSNEPLEETDDEFLVNMVQSEHLVLSAEVGKPSADELSGMALSDTCCSRSVCGEKWMQKHLKKLWEKGEDFYIIAEKQYYRFGAGPRIASDYAAVIPLNIKGSCAQAFMRVSVVKQAVPLLMSRRALQGLGAILDLPGGEIQFRELGTMISLDTTHTGHVGFKIDAEPNTLNYDNVIAFEDLCQHLQDESCEIIIAPSNSRTQGCQNKFVKPLYDNQEPPNSSKGDNNQQGNQHVDTVHQCSSLLS